MTHTCFKCGLALFECSGIEEDCTGCTLLSFEDLLCGECADDVSSDCDCSICNGSVEVA